MHSPWAGLAVGSYGVILADPPWSFATRSAKGQGKSSQAHYECMSLADLRALPVVDLAARDCALVTWATAPLLPAAVDLIGAWGFKYKTCGAWAKQSRTGSKIAFGTGYIYRSATEFYLLGTRGAPKAQVRNVRNLILAPVREHSRKPDQMRADLQRLFPGPYVELFARERADGWDAWGNQTEHFQPQETLQWPTPTPSPT